MKHGITFAMLALAASVTCAFGADPLFQLIGCNGVCQVLKPGDAEYQNAVKGKAYPFGTVVRTQKAGAASLQLSPDDTVTLAADTVATPVLEKDGDALRRVVNLDGGKVTVFTIAEDGALLSLVTPVAECTGLRGRSDIALAAPSKGSDAYVLKAQAASGGSVTISGPQFKVPDLKAGYSVEVSTTSDRSFTRILNTLGDYPILIDGGADEPVSIATSTKSAIRIWREFAPIGHREIVSVFATGPDGKGRERFAFAVGQPLVAAAVAAQDWTEDEDGGDADEGEGGDAGELDFDAAFGGGDSGSSDEFSSDGDGLFF